MPPSDAGPPRAGGDPGLARLSRGPQEKADLARPVLDPVVPLENDDPDTSPAPEGQCNGECEIVNWKYDGYRFIEGPDGEEPRIVKEDEEAPDPGLADIGQAIKDATDVWAARNSSDRLCPDGCICRVSTESEQITHTSLRARVPWTWPGPEGTEGGPYRYSVVAQIYLTKVRIRGECVPDRELYELADPYGPF